MTCVLGLSALYHDSAACLLRDGEIVAAAQEERFTRKKGDADFPANAVAYCLKEAGVTMADVSHVGFYDKPLLKFERILETYAAVAPRGFASFLKAGPVWMKEKLFIDDEIRSKLGDYSGELLFAEHHESHAASAFYPSPFDEAAILTVDGVGEWATASYGMGQGNRISLTHELRWPDSLGLLYSAFTYFTGFKVNSGEYKVMGLAPYGEPKYVDRIYDHLIELRDDGSFTMNQEYFNYLTGLTMTSAKFATLFDGPRRVPESTITQRDKDLARSIQDVTEEIMLGMARHVHRETGARNLCLAGGVALNAVANGRILREGPFEKLWIQPAAGDAGGALGVALLIWHRSQSAPRAAHSDSDSMRGALLGPAYSSDEIHTFLESTGASYERLDRPTLNARVAELLASEKVIGWFNGRMEFGPRALGNRSILGDPRSARMQSEMNLKIKFRESFRPFAPAVLRERVSDWFELKGDSPYMLIIAPVTHGTLPAVTHVDNSARIQTVDRETNPDFYDLIKAFEAKAGCPVLINTSFNVRGEPIVCTPADAYRCFLKTNIDYLVLGDFLLSKPNQPARADGSTARAPSALRTEHSTLSFTLTLAVAFAVLGLLSAWRHHPDRALVAGAIAATMVAIQLVAPRMILPIRDAWMKLGHALSRVTTPIVLGVVYFIVLTPIGVVRRAVGRNSLRQVPKGESGWIRRDSSETAESMRRTF